MVMYRKKDQNNAQFNKKATWSKSLTNLCSIILQDEEDEATRRERQKNMCNVSNGSMYLVLLSLGQEKKKHG